MTNGQRIYELCKCVIVMAFLLYAVYFLFTHDIQLKQPTNTIPMYGVSVTDRVNVGIIFTGEKDDHKVLAILVPNWEFPLKSTDEENIYIDSTGKKVKFPSDLIKWEVNTDE